MHADGVQELQNARVVSYNERLPGESTEWWAPPPTIGVRVRTGWTAIVWRDVDHAVCASTLDWPTDSDDAQQASADRIILHIRQTTQRFGGMDRWRAAVEGLDPNPPPGGARWDIRRRVEAVLSPVGWEFDATAVEPERRRVPRATRDRRPLRRHLDPRGAARATAARLAM